MLALIMSYGFWISFSVLLTLFLEFCFREDGIFEFWLPWVSKLYHKTVGIEIDAYDYDSLVDNCWICKPLGGCVVCLGFWVAVIVLFPFISHSFIYYIFSVLLVNFLVRLFYNIII